MVNGTFVRETVARRGAVFANPVLLVHGGSHGWWAWLHWQRSLARSGWRTFAMSLPGHGDSRPLSEDELRRMRLDDYAASVTEVVEWLSVVPILVGHSMGGNLVQKVAYERQLADRQPLALVLVAPVGPRGTPVRPPVAEDRPVVLTEQQARSMFFHDIDDQTFARIYPLLVPESPAALNDYTVGGVIPDRAITCPVLVLGPEHDRAILRQHAREAAEFYRAPLVRVSGAGHDLMLEGAAEQSAAFVSSWLAINVVGQLPRLMPAPPPP
jgi:pimeloyl-ACP methyl ester carboxylesterase